MRAVLGNGPAFRGITSHVALDVGCSASAREQRETARDWHRRDEILNRDGRSLTWLKAFVNTGDSALGCASVLSPESSWPTSVYQPSTTICRTDGYKLDRHAPGEQCAPFRTDHSDGDAIDRR